MSRVVEAPPDRIWSVLTHTRYWPEWGPSVSAVDPPDAEIRAGTTGRVRTPVGVAVEFEVTECAPYRWTWTVAGVPATGHRIDPQPDGTSRVVFELPAVAFPYVPVCELALRRIERLVTE